MPALRFAWLALALLLLLPLAPFSPAQQRKQAPAGKSASAKKTTPARKTAAKRRTRTRRRSSRAGQQQPTQARHAEIQRALADKGYFEGEIDGKWGEESVDALKRFQQDQNLKADGKLSSLSLIALGLGPKRSLPAQVGAPVEPPAAPAAGQGEPPQPPPQ